MSEQTEHEPCPDSGWCNLCDGPLEGGSLEEILDHLRVMHPDQYEPPERWPDGGLVIHDDTLTPDDFREGRA